MCGLLPTECCIRDRGISNDDLIDRLGNARFISTIDLTRGYWQMPVAAEDQHKTAFVTPFGLFQFKVLPFGLSGPPTEGVETSPRSQFHS